MAVALILSGLIMLFGIRPPAGKQISDLAGSFNRTEERSPTGA
jgi:hypothetical protein